MLLRPSITRTVVPRWLQERIAGRFLCALPSSRVRNPLHRVDADTMRGGDHAHARPIRWIARLPVDNSRRRVENLIPDGGGRRE
jgi:hypothetical protein